MHPFSFPREYSFPPFFTRQTNLTTHHAQLTKWSSLVLSYCRHHRIFRLSPSQATSDPSAPAAELFHNRLLNRRLSAADAREVLDFMRRDGRAELVSGSGGGAGLGDVFWIHWRTPEEWAGMVEGWIEETAQKGAVLTVYELREGDATEGTEFHMLDADILNKALNVLVKRGKAQIFGSEDSQGVKFF